MKCEHFEKVKGMTRPVEVGMWLHFLYGGRDDAFLVLGTGSRNGEPWVMTLYDKGKKGDTAFRRFGYYPLEGFDSAHAHTEYPW